MLPYATTHRRINPYFKYLNTNYDSLQIALHLTNMYAKFQALL